jgi:hypothetical protein
MHTHAHYQSGGSGSAIDAAGCSLLYMPVHAMFCFQIGLQLSAVLRTACTVHTLRVSHTRSVQMLLGN